MGVAVGFSSRQLSRNEATQEREMFAATNQRLPLPRGRGCAKRG